MKTIYTPIIEKLKEEKGEYRDTTRWQYLKGQVEAFEEAEKMFLEAMEKLKKEIDEQSTGILEDEEIYKLIDKIIEGKK